MPLGDTYGRSMTQGDASETRCVTRQLLATARLALRVTQMTQIGLSTHGAGAHTRTHAHAKVPFLGVTCVMRHRPSTTRRVGPRGGRLDRAEDRRRQCPDASWANVGDPATNVDDRRYFPGLSGPNPRTEDPQYPTGFVALDRTRPRNARTPRVARHVGDRSAVPARPANRRPLVPDAPRGDVVARS